MAGDQVTEMRDQQLATVLGQLNSSLKEWDSQKCPTMR